MLDTPSLLITDDDRDFRETLRSIFHRRGFSTLLAADGEEAIRIVSDRTVHVVLMDLHMPRVSGLEAIGRIRELNSRLPCILISATLSDDLRACTEAFSVLSKPISHQEVTSTVQAALRVVYDWPHADGDRGDPK